MSLFFSFGKLISGKENDLKSTKQFISSYKPNVFMRRFIFLALFLIIAILGNPSQVIAVKKLSSYSNVCNLSPTTLISHE